MWKFCGSVSCYINVTCLKARQSKGCIYLSCDSTPHEFFLLSSALSPDELKNRTKLTDAKELQFLNPIHVGEPFIEHKAATWMPV